ncbi:MAG: FprA family A-type flavoprotein [Lachnospiraceae bacterium]|nr:FprA family A-type flavoprotein [Lachnospiraceae bacterium]
MKNTYISDSIVYVGVDDRTIDLFESQYHVPNGVSYNSYIIFDEKIAVMDTVDARGTESWLKNVKEALGDKTPDYLVVQHMEPDHAGNLKILADMFPDMKLVGNKKTFPMIRQFFELDLPEERIVTVGEGDTLSLGKHVLQFFMAPMVHWPEVMVTYEQSEKILFAADGFGKFGALDAEEEWTDEARRYFINIVGKYGAQVQALLKKAATLDIQMICPLHGPILREDLGFYIGKYLTWSSYEPEEEGVVIAYASIHGNTAKAAKQFAAILEEKGAENVTLFDLSRDDMAEAIAYAYRYDKLVLAAASYDGGVFPCMEDFLNHLRAKNFQKRKVAYIQNGSWAPSAGKVMKSLIEPLKNIREVEPMVTIKSALKPENVSELEALADALLA